MTELIFAVSLAVVVSFFCSIAEAVLYSFSWSKIEGLRRDGRKAGDILYAMRTDVDKPLTAILTLNTVAHTVGASLAGAAWAKVFGEQSLGWFALVFTVVILIFSEILPKTMGVVHNAFLAPLMARPLAGLIWLLQPVIWICSFISRFAGGGKTGPDATEHDITSLASLVSKAGVITPQEEKTIQNILTLDTKHVHDVMTPRTVVFSLPMDQSVDEAVNSTPQWPHSRFPVYAEDSEDVVGIVTRQEVFKALAENRGDKPLSTFMRPVRFVLETMPLDAILRQFLESRLHLFVVLDEYGGLSGVITLEDVLEEILGQEIVDETDETVDLQALALKQREELLGRISASYNKKEAAKP
jgi:CBS domain containing-hemolysin-like protein